MAETLTISPMYYLSLDIQNVKCFGDRQTLNLSNKNGGPAPWTLLIGDNGVGKTTLLQCIAWMRPGEDPEHIKEGKITVKPILDNLEDNSEYEKLFRNDGVIESFVGARLSDGMELDASSVPREKILDHGLTITGENGELKDIKSKFAYVAEFNEPNLFAYSATRHMEHDNLEKSELADPVYNLFSEAGDLYDAERVLLNLDYQARIDGRGSPAEKILNKIKKLLVDLLPDLEDESAVYITGPKILPGTKATGGVLIDMPYGRVPISALSLGYKTMFAWAVELALRLFDQNPESEAPLEQPAVVLVDEIDLHLHPMWQRTVRSYLQEHFPNTQFICTAHSPLMAQASENENVVVLRRVDDEVHIDNSPFLIEGWRVDQILTSDLFGMPSKLSYPIEQLQDKRYRLLNIEGRTQHEERELKKIDEFITNLPVSDNPDDVDAIQIIREAAAAIKKINS